MSTILFEPKVDYVFKNLFGSEKHPRILISFLNACIKPLHPIVEVHLKNTEISKEYIEDSFSRLDVLAKTNKGEIINIEMNDSLTMWTAFIKDPNDSKVIELESVLEELHEARVELARISRDPKEAENYRLRQNAMNERMNALLEAENKGRVKRIAQTAKNMLNKGMDIEIISEVTGLSKKEIIELK